MRLVCEELFTRVPLPVVYVVTTNATIKRDGSLVMGRGAAREVRDMIPGIDLECGRAVVVHGYGYLEIRSPFRPRKAGFGIFQVKHEYNQPASADLIRLSVECLLEKIDESYGKLVSVRMNFPGIGNGRLRREEVEPLLAPLPNSVTVCYR